MHALGCVMSEIQLNNCCVSGLQFLERFVLNAEKHLVEMLRAALKVQLTLPLSAISLWVSSEFHRSD